MTFKLNMTDDEAARKDFEFPPSGNYLVRIASIELKEVEKVGDNFGKPFWKLSLVVEEGEYKGTSIPTTVMLFDGALSTIKRLCEAVHPEYIEGNNILLPTVENGMPDPTPWEGQLISIKGTKFPAGTRVARGKRAGELREYDEFQIQYKSPNKKGVKATANGLPLPS